MPLANEETGVKESYNELVGGARNKFQQQSILVSITAYGNASFPQVLVTWC